MQRVILHVDGDGFFAGCEVAKNPSLKGKPVVVGRERGMALAMTTEAKVCGVKRGMTLHEVRRICPNAIILDTDHQSYALFSARMNNIIERYTAHLERYSIDESFADITTMHTTLRMSHEDIAMELKTTLKQELGMTFSIGVAPTKVLAKLGSKHKKPDGLTVIHQETINDFLRKTPIEHVWGIGPATSAFLQEASVVTAHDFTQKSEHWVSTMLAKPYRDVWHELRGINALTLNTGARNPYHSLMRTRTFAPPTHARKFLLAELSRHTEVVCARAREHHLAGKTFSFFLKTQGLRFRGIALKLQQSTNTPEALITLIDTHLNRAYEEDALYRATGVTLGTLTDAVNIQRDLFDTTLRVERIETLHREIDLLNTKFGEPVIHLASSLHMQKKQKVNFISRDEQSLARLHIPLIGTIS